MPDISAAVWRPRGTAGVAGGRVCSGAAMGCGAPPREAAAPSSCQTRVISCAERGFPALSLAVPKARAFHSLDASSHFGVRRLSGLRTCSRSYSRRLCHRWLPRLRSALRRSRAPRRRRGFLTACFRCTCVPAQTRLLRILPLFRVLRGKAEMGTRGGNVKTSHQKAYSVGQKAPSNKYLRFRRSRRPPSGPARRPLRSARRKKFRRLPFLLSLLRR